MGKITKEEFNELIGKTDLSYFLDIQYHKGRITAQTLENYYDELFYLVNKLLSSKKPSDTHAEKEGGEKYGTHI